MNLYISTAVEIDGPIPEEKHTHVALDDAIEQGRLFVNMLQARRDAGGAESVVSRANQ